MAHPRFGDIAVCVFDAYGTLFDHAAAARRHDAALGAKAGPLAETWRIKQLQYTWVRSLMGRHAPFWQVTGEALDYAMAAHGIADISLRAGLMDAYLTLDAYPEVPATLAALKAAGLATAILSNGSPRMLEAAVATARIGDALDIVLSVEEVGVYKPHPKAYRLATTHFGVPAERVSFQSSNAWDANGAAAFGFRVAWCNRIGQGRERLPAPPDAEIATLAELPPLLGLA